MPKLTLDLETLTVTTFETDSDPAKGNPNAVTIVDCSNCNTRLTCSTALC